LQNRLIDLKPTLILLFGLSFAACTQGEGETLLEARFALAGELPAFDPLQAEQSAYQVLQRQVFETLTEYVPNGESGAVQPLLAESWKISENGLTWTFELREEAFFYDPWPNPLWPERRRSVTAADVVECWTIQKEQGQGGWAFEGFISDFKAIGQRSLEIQLFHSDDSLTQRLASAYFAVYPPEALRLSSRRFGDHPVGSGPYFLSAWIPGHEAVFLKTPQWRGQKQNGQAVAEIEKIRFTSIREGSTRTLLFQNGKLDRLSPGQDAFHTFLKNGQLAEDWQRKGYRSLSIAMPDLTMIAFNLEDPVLKKKAVRQAIAMAFPYERWHRVLRNGVWAVPAKHFLPPGVAHATDAPVCSFLKTDLDLAKQLLKQAGHPNGSGIPPLQFELAGSDAMSRAQGEMMEQALGAIGIELKAIPNTWTRYVEKTRQGKAQIWSRGWTLDWPDPLNLLSLFLASQTGSVNHFGYKNKTFDALAVAYRTEDATKKADIVHAMVAILNEDLPAIPIDHRIGWAVLGPRVLHMPIHPFDPYACKFYRLKPLSF